MKRVVGAPFYWLYKKKLWRQIRDKPKPHHVGIILDGNRRFASEHGNEPWVGHVIGAQKVEEVLAFSFECGIRGVTLYAFSTENFNRSETEVQKIMEIAIKKFTEILKNPMIHKYRVRVKAIGKTELLPEQVQKVIKDAEEVTKNYEDYFLNIAIGYGGRIEIIDAVKEISKKVKNGELDINDITEEEIEKNLYTSGLPDPDVIIRTSGEERLSGFLLWQSAYSELIFLDVYWPAIRKIDFWRAIRTYQQRDRRYGK
ncbi:MAG: di-trans,poly-cis-decaprenylcistransferase [Candidatus Lokiarchaeota archaeon]|nr:di-trans,poly-cis-decaprenylcistransferase [Candidatus Lokiarchaeota archaeon]